MDKWICNKCGYETTTQPIHKNCTCEKCGKGRFKLIRICECGKEYHPTHYGQQYCSKECGYKFKFYGGKKGNHYPHTQRARIAICEVCGKSFRAVNEYKDRISKYCSKECWSKRGRKKYKLKRSPEFLKWKRAVFERDNRTCQMCGATSNLEAHHIKEKVNYPELEFDVDNGICLCHDCHTKTDNYGYRAKLKLRK